MNRIIGLSEWIPFCEIEGNEVVDEGTLSYLELSKGVAIYPSCLSFL